MIKKLSLVNALSFDIILPKNIMCKVFEYLGEENKRIVKEIARNSISRPNISTAENCKLYVEQMSSDSGNFKQFLIMFKTLNVEDQEHIFNILHMRDILRLFHVPKKMERRMRYCLMGVEKVQKSKQVSAHKSWMSDPFEKKPEVILVEKEENVPKSKLERFNDMIDEYRRISTRNVKENNRRLGVVNKNKPVKNLSRILSFDW